MQERLHQDMKDAMRAQDTVRRDTVRMLISALKNAAIDKRGELTEEDQLDVLAREAKKRREAADSYRGVGRPDVADKEEAELRVIEDYLPKQLTEDDVRAIAREVIAELKPTTARDMGKVMSEVMPRLKGRVDGKRASALIREEFNSAVAG